MRSRAQVLANIVDCGNAAEKFRRLRISNGKFHDGVWCKPGGSQVCSPSSASPTPMTLSPTVPHTHVRYSPRGPSSVYASRVCCLQDSRECLA